MNRSSKTYAIGYGKPPAETRFKKGQSGNPKGRPKRAKPETLGVDGFLLRHLDSMMDVTISGQRKRIRGDEAIALKMFNKALSGDQKAIDHIAKLTARSVAAFRPTEDDEQLVAMSFGVALDSSASDTSVQNGDAGSDTQCESFAMGGSDEER